MSVSLLHHISSGQLPIIVLGQDVAAIESLVDAGLIKATVVPDPMGLGDCRATVHEITPLGRKYLCAFAADL